MVNSSTVRKRAIQIATLAVLLSSLGVAQTAALSLSSGSGSPGNIVSLTLSLTGSGGQPAAVQWTLPYSATDISALSFSAGAMATAAGKSISCNSTAGSPTCVVWGMNSNTIANGPLANITLTLSSSTKNSSTAISVTNAASATAGGLAMTTSATGTSVSITQPTNTVTGVVCTPDAVIPPAGSTCQVIISPAAPSAGVSVTIGSSSGNVIEPTSLTIPSGATVSSFSLTTTSVSSPTTAQITATLGSSSASFPLLLLTQPTSNGLAVDVTISQNSPSSGATVTSPSFSTAKANELLLAFVATGGSAPVTAASVNGAGLTWALVGRTNLQKGTAEIWRAFSPSALSNVVVTANLSSSVLSSLTVMSFTGADPGGSNGAGAIGATASTSGSSGVPTASLVTTRDGSWVIGVGNDVTSATARVAGPYQWIVNQYTPSGNTYWVQEQVNPTPNSGTIVTINDTNPAADAYNLTTAEVLPVSACVVAMVPQNRSFTTGGGSSNVVVADGPGCNWTATTDSPAWITLNGNSGTGNGSFSYNVAGNVGETRMGTVTIGSTSFKVMEGGTTQIFTDVPTGTQYFDYITQMYETGITAGCQASPLMYCPSTAVTREQMATFVVSALDHLNHAGGQIPPVYTLTPYFQDVPATDPLFPYVQRLADLGVTNGCQASPPLFCPTQAIPQGQMAKFMIVGWMKVNNLSTFTYSQTPYFTDVPPTDMFFSYIQKMMDMQFWTGCGSGQYCESSSVTRAQMAPLIMRSLEGAP